jgi:hypothetical protein
MKVIRKLVDFVKNRELHAWMGGKIALVKSDQEAAILVIERLAGTKGKDMVRQVNIALGYEGTLSGCRGYLANQTLNNLMVVANRSRQLTTAFLVAQGGSSASGGNSFRSRSVVENAPSVVQQARPERLEEPRGSVKSGGGWNFTFDFRWTRG